MNKLYVNSDVTLAVARACLLCGKKEAVLFACCLAEPVFGSQKHPFIEVIFCSQTMFMNVIFHIHECMKGKSGESMRMVTKIQNGSAEPHVNKSPK